MDAKPVQTVNEEDTFAEINLESINGNDDELGETIVFFAFVALVMIVFVFMLALIIRLIRKHEI